VDKKTLCLYPKAKVDDDWQEVCGPRVQDLVHLSTNQTQSSEKNKAFVTNMAVAGRILSSQL